MKKKLALLLMTVVIMTQGVMANAASTHYMEEESNDSLSSANRYNAYSSNTSVYGVVSSYDDYDYFRFVATESGAIEVEFYFDKSTSSSDIDIDFKIYDSDGSTIDTFNDSYFAYRRINIEEGDYISVRVDHDDGYLGSPYEIIFNMD